MQAYIDWIYDPTNHDWLVLGVFAAAVVTVLALVFISAPYGRHARAGWGPTMPSRAAWVIMESPAVLLFIWVYAQGRDAGEVAPLVMLALFQLHYIHRTFIWPFRMRLAGKRTPVLVALLAIVWNLVNCSINAPWIAQLGDFAGHAGTSWLTSPMFIAGTVLFLAGMGINIHADNVLLNLRKPGETGYKIPRGGMYHFVSSPNYLGEILEWCGWGLLSMGWAGGMAGWAFAVYTAANLAPRAFTNHRWYLDKFEDYPPERKALVPFVV